jgi:hypothetical protein
MKLDNEFSGYSSLAVVLVPVACQKVITKSVRGSSKVGVVEPDQNSSWAFFNFLFAAKIHKFEIS